MEGGGVGSLLWRDGVCLLDCSIVFDVDLCLLEGDEESGLLTFWSVDFAEDLGRLGDGGDIYLS